MYNSLLLHAYPHMASLLEWYEHALDFFGCLVLASLLSSSFISDVAFPNTSFFILLSWTNSALSMDNEDFSHYSHFDT